VKISIENINPDTEEEIIIRCHEITDEILGLMKKLKSKSTALIGYEDTVIYQLKLSDVYYFEAVDNKVFIYCRDKVYESRQKLYELEQLTGNRKFFRASKSVILNITKIAYVKPSISGRFEAAMDNGETVMVSRQYVPVLKTMLGL
jgi:DNA-binding LytR/AlgR family response regulator